MSEPPKSDVVMVCAKSPDAMKVAVAMLFSVPEPGLSLSFKLIVPPLQVSVFSLRRMRPPSRVMPLELIVVGP